MPHRARVSAAVPPTPSATPGPDVRSLRTRALAFAFSLLAASAAPPQTNPLAAVSGRVTDPSGAPVGGVAVSATSPSLQGVRETSTTGTGDFLLPLLVPGDYEIVFRHTGFREARVDRTLRATETVRLDVALELGEASEEITVTAEPASVIGGSAAVASVHGARSLERLPVDRSIRGAVLLTPGTTAESPSASFRIAGAGSYDNLYLVDGVGVEDIVFGAARPYPIEDAIEETTTLVAGISAEYGRFTGGLVHAVTRSGGNELHGSLRVTLEDESWRSLTPYEREALDADPRSESVVPTYEATLGGPLLRDRLWYFLAGRRQETSRAETLAYTDLPYRYRNREARYQSKVTWSPHAAVNLRVSYGAIDTREENFAFSPPVMDYASLSPGNTPEDLVSVHGSATAGTRHYLEAQYSRRRRAPTGFGARTTDLVSGTVLRDGLRGGAAWHSPILCGVCGVPPGELRRAAESDEGFVLKGSGFYSGARAGAHHLVVGGEVADELRKSNSFQSGSGYIVTASSARIENGAIYPVFVPGSNTIVTWAPIFELSHGSRFRTVSAFVNDDWRLGERWSVNLGLRWDADDSRDQAGVRVGRSDAWSPRLQAVFDPRGNGEWTIDTGFARYVNSLNFHVGDFGTSAGRPARFLYTYDGPAVNLDPAAPLLSSDEALAILFDWFFANGGTSRPLRQAPAIPGLNRRTGPELEPTRSDELTLGVTRRLGGRGSVRLAGVRREFSRQYIERVDRSTGRVTDPGSGREYDLRLLENGDGVERTWEALLAQADLRLRPGLRFAGAYTLSRTRGRFDGDGASAEAALESFPEYGEERWRAPSGPLRGDRRHRVRLWASWDAPLAERRGRLSVSALERVDSGHAWEAVGEIDSRRYVENPGYVGPPARVSYYFERPGSRRTETEVATDLALLYAYEPRRLRGVELFARLVVVNLFDTSAQTGTGDATVLTAANDPRYAPFDPFTEEPVRGVHWDLAPGFGRALGAADFATPRTLTLSLGARF